MHYNGTASILGTNLTDSYFFNTNCTLTNSVTIGGRSTTDLLTALNAWVAENQSAYPDYEFKTWQRKSNTEGVYPELIME